VNQTNDGVRLQKVLAEAGIASRRNCEDLIAAGRVMVDGEKITWFGARVDPQKAIIHVDGKRIPTRTELRYYALNKTLVAYVGDVPERLFHVGRLDTDTEGLLLLTNDGELANRLMHPRYGVAKTYLAEIHGPIGRDLGKRLRQGVKLADGFAKADAFRIFDQVGKRVLVEVTLHEGRKHIVRRLLSEVGHPVQQLARTEFGPVKLGRLRTGTIRALTTREIGELYAAVEL